MPDIFLGDMDCGNRALIRYDLDEGHRETPSARIEFDELAIPGDTIRLILSELFVDRCKFFYGCK